MPAETAPSGIMRANDAFERDEPAVGADGGDAERRGLEEAREADFGRAGVGGGRTRGLTRICGNQKRARAVAAGKDAQRHDLSALDRDVEIDAGADCLECAGCSLDELEALLRDDIAELRAPAPQARRGSRLSQRRNVALMRRTTPRPSTSIKPTGAASRRSSVDLERVHGGGLAGALVGHVLDRPQHHGAKLALVSRNGARPLGDAEQAARLADLASRDLDLLAPGLAAARGARQAEEMQLRERGSAENSVSRPRRSPPASRPARSLNERLA